MSKNKTPSIHRRRHGCCQLVLICIVGIACPVTYAGDIGMFNDPALGVDVMIGTPYRFRVFPYVGALSAPPIKQRKKMGAITQPGIEQNNGKDVGPAGPAQLRLGNNTYALTADEKVCTYQNHVAISVMENDAIILYAKEVPVWIYRCDQFKKIRVNLGFGVAHYLAWREQFVKNLEVFQTTYAVHSDINLAKLFGIATDPQDDNRQFAIITLASFGKSVMPKLVSMLTNNETADTALAVLRMLGQKTPAATSAVAALLTKNFTNIQHRDIYHTLETTGTPSPDATSIVLKKLSKAPLKDRSHIFRALATVGRDDPRAHQALITHLKHPNYNIRKQAAIAMGNMGRCIPEAVPLLKRNRRTTLLRLSATWALYQMKNAYWETRNTEHKNDVNVGSETSTDNSASLACDVSF